ncbi:MAG: PilZ domain-containing protein [Myxococcota bacterium]
MSTDDEREGEPLESAVDLYVMGAAMRSLPGRIVRRDGPELWVAVFDGRLEDGEAVCLQSETSAPWLYGKVKGVESDGAFCIHIDGSHTPDRREFSRVWGPLNLRFQALDDDGYELASLRWLRKGEGIGPRWQRPPMFMDFSGSGARFETRGVEPAEPDQRLLVGIQIPGDMEEHRFTARAVRTLNHDSQLAIHFLEANEGAIAALVDFAERIQEQLVDLLGDPQGPSEDEEDAEF